MSFNIVGQKLDIDGKFAEFNPTYYKLGEKDTLSDITKINRPTYDGGIYVVKLELTHQMTVGDLIGMLSKTQQDQIKVLNVSGFVLSKNQYSETILTTGMRIMMTDGNTVTDDFYIAISGDVNKDGEVNNIDLSTMKRYLRGMATLVGVEVVAADISCDCQVDIEDISLFTSW